MSSDKDSAYGDASDPGEKPFVDGASGNDGFSRLAAQESGASSDNPFANPSTNPSTVSHGFGPRPKPSPPNHHHHATNPAEVEALLRPFFHHTNVPTGAKQANGSLRLSRDWAVKMLGTNQFHRADNGQQVLNPGSELGARSRRGLKLPATIIDWLEDVNGHDQVMVPAAVVRQYWTRPKYADS